MTDQISKTESKDEAADFGSKDVTCVERTLGYQGFMRLEKILLKHRLFEGGWSKLLSRELLIRKDAVAVLLYDSILDKVVLIEQFRVGAMQDSQSPWMLELVAGLMDKNETPQDLAKRECFEEAGCEVLSLEPIFEFYLSPGACTEKLYLYLACVDSSQLGGVFGVDEEGEDIKVHVLPALQAFDYLSCGRINNAITIIGLQWLQINRLRLYQATEEK